ncbi:nucleotidyltransferase domain-containing protein [Aeoliella sp. ICT_H6.2]|uniref:Nucleotidyltransferase domain-containing protein n=1 Tax=Aeoliella straminimaris TaxID=2954799 RepID=A0A9X2F5M9_9BACT|nr:nucleotidyltransferase domain-containing protein [Aeoliella straminimaris]MCO6042680.1 nucleotidyltransferase domain-containing protein [Aeoliella straminimaris]
MQDVLVDYEHLENLLVGYPYPLLYVSACGPHQQGFGPADSRVELRGVHSVPHSQISPDGSFEELIHRSIYYKNGRVDIVTLDIEVFNRMLLGGDSRALEDLYSPLIVVTSAVHSLLKAAATHYVSCTHFDDYQKRVQHWKGVCFADGAAAPTHALLQVYRILLTAVRFLRTGDVETNLLALVRTANLSHLESMLDGDRFEKEFGRHPVCDPGFHKHQISQLEAELESAMSNATLSESQSDEGVFGQMLTFSRFYLPSSSNGTDQ